MSTMIDKTVKFTIQADSIKDAEKQAKEESKVKKIISSKLKTKTYEVEVIQEWYGEHNLGYCQYCGTSLCHYSEVFAESCGCDEYPEGYVVPKIDKVEEDDDLPF